MALPATLAAATPITPPSPAITSRPIPLFYSHNLSHHKLKPRSDLGFVSRSTTSAAIVDNPITAEEEEIQAKVGARVRVTVPLKVYHIPKVPEVDLKGKEGKLKEYVAVWKGKHISANLPYKIEFLEKFEERGDAPVKFFAHLKDDEFEYID